MFLRKTVTKQDMTKLIFKWSLYPVNHRRMVFLGI